MLVFAHTGLALGAAAVAEGARHRPQAGSAPARGSLAAVNRFLLHGLQAFARVCDVRLFLLGSLLPDIIDKPLGLWLLRDALQNGRIYAHTLLFLLLLAAGGLILYLGRRRTWGLALSLGVFIHLVLDGMWRNPHTLLWPLQGAAFAREPIAPNWVMAVVQNARHDPAVWVPELLGLICLAWLGGLWLREWSARRGPAFSLRRRDS